MYTFITEVEHEETNRWFLLEIDFDYEYPENYFHDGHWNHIPGEIYLNNVKVLEAILYDEDGDEAVKMMRAEMKPVTLDTLDNQMYRYVDNEIDDWNQLADDMVDSI